MHSLAQLLRNDKYQVFLFSSLATIPFCFVRHPWFVVNREGVLSRWEVFWEPSRSQKSWGHLHKDFYPPEQGIEMFFFPSNYFWPGTLDMYIEGGRGSLAHKMADFIEASPEKYPRCYQYSLLGPNSVTYAEWALDAFPESGLHQRWNSFVRFLRK